VRDGFRPDLVHAHHLWLMTALAREMFEDVPLVATSHNAELRQAVKAPHLAERARPGLARIDRVCVLTPRSVRDTVDGFGVAPERITITGAGYDHTLFSLPGEPPADRTIVWVGRLSTSKGVPFLLDAVRCLPDPIRLLLVGATGTGDDGRGMDTLVHAAGERVIHLGAQPREEVARILRGSSIFVLPSLFEGLPLTMLEALGCGCPAVVSALPTIASWIPPRWLEQGWVELVPPLRTTRADVPVLDDVPRFVDDLAAAIERQLDRAGDLAWRRALAAELPPHSWSAVFARYERVYGEVATARP
jgi:glycosyltransferase involved in cell wall biosynthesis